MKAFEHCRLPTHRLPDLKCNSVHVEQPHLISAFAGLSIDADCRQKFELFRFDQVLPHTDGWGILDILHFLCTLSDDLVIQCSSRMSRIEIEQQIVRCMGSSSIFRIVHMASSREAIVTGYARPSSVDFFCRENQ